MLKKTFVDDDDFNYDSDSTCPTNNSITYRKKHKQIPPSARGRAGYCYVTLHSILLVSLGLLVSNSKINFEGYFPQHLLTTEASSHYTQQKQHPTWTFGVPSLSLNSTFTSSAGLIEATPHRSFDLLEKENHSSTYSSLFGFDRVNRSKRLEFVHVTKTGGSAIEMGAAAFDVQWGVCHYRRIPRLGCNSTANWAWPIDRDFPRHMVNRTECEPWHTPPHWLIPNPQPSDKVANFIVVRDPYQRVLSEYYCPSFGYRSPISRQGGLKGNASSAATLNSWIVDMIQKDRIFHGHLMPQHYYVFHHVTGARLIDHVLKYESLDDEFNRLMELYQMKVRLPPRRASQSAMLVVDTTARLLSVADLTLDTIQVINEYYRLDFERFDYTMITHS